ILSPAPLARLGYPCNINLNNKYNINIFGKQRKKLYFMMKKIVQGRKMYIWYLKILVVNKNLYWSLDERS
ncbi:MAG: hypothetical protein KAR55_01815, partial [Thermoplasmatales archaeon]|nr:hypothetical protein [Thermoplasmatales archaeon]